MCILLGGSLPVGAFEQDGFRSGMTKAEVQSLLAGIGQRLGPPLGETPDFAAYVGIVIDADGKPAMPSDGAATFGFCHAQLISYSHDVQFDSDYATLLEEQISRFGKPSAVTVRRQTWNGPGGGLIPTVEMRWYHGNDRIALEFSPEGRTPEGKLRFYRHSQIFYSRKNECWGPKYW